MISSLIKYKVLTCLCNWEKYSVVSCGVCIIVYGYSLFVLCRHVQVSNDDALEFYQKFSFQVVDTKEQYYKRIDPPHAYVLQKDLKGPLGLPVDSAGL